MIPVLKSTGQIIWQTLEEFLRDGCPQMAAALSYYTVFSLPPLLVLIILMVEPILDPAEVAAALHRELGGLMGPQGAAQVQTLMENVQRPGGSLVPTLVGVAAFAFGATVAFAQLQNALNRAWHVGPDPTRGDVKNFLLKRVLSFAMILSIGFLLLVSLVVSTLLAAFGGRISALTEGWLSPFLLQLINLATSFVVVALLFAAMFRLLPDAVVAWRDALLGGVVTAALFELGKTGIGLYLGRTDLVDVYGAAGSLAVVLIWIYYSSMILLLGAEFTWVWASRRGRPIEPEPGAVRIARTQERVDPEPG
jgi:membrane protein